MANAMQLRALQTQVKEMQDCITLIDLNVRDVVRGQQNDRLALYQSGLELFLEARNVSDDALKRQLLHRQYVLYRTPRRNYPCNCSPMWNGLGASRTKMQKVRTESLF